ncbi:hypothetical protein [Achromobacter xylosoxidans]|uniref:hypothetical protein n=1 Tax=Alcaligenes xylosoxydans xylosoxydans TaxID=85698 RepID=UPI001EEAE3BB|nr:hypothetical protein [Achromobacter xylosoxidans]
MSKIENTWRLAPVAAAQHELAEVRAALGFLPQGYTAMAGLERLADLLAAAEPSPTSPAVSTEHDEPITVTVDHDPRGVSVGVWQGSHCIYSGAHPLPAAAGVSMVEEDGTTPGATWREKGEADPHGTRYNCERAALTLGTLTDDELANGAFLAYDRQPSVEELLSGKGFTPIVWMTAVKDRIRWLSRKLAEAEGRAAPAADDARNAVDVDWQLLRETAMLVRDRFSAALSIAYASSDATRSAIRRAHETYEALLAMLDAAIAAQRKGDA